MMTTREESRKDFVRFCREQKESWLICTVDKEQLFWLWQSCDELNKARIAEQLLTIKALNDCIGGKGSLTTDNLVLVGRLENRIAQLELENKTLREALESAIESTDDYNMIDISNGKQYFKHEIFKREIEVLATTKDKV